MNIDELNNLASVFKSNEEVLKTGGSMGGEYANLTNEVKNYVLTEFDKVRGEELKLLYFINTNIDMFLRNHETFFHEYGMCCACGTDCTTHKTAVTYLGLQDKIININYNGKYLPFYDQFYKGDFSTVDNTLEYWTGMKSIVNYRRWRIGIVSRKVKEIVNSVIAEQKARMEKIVKVCKEIDAEKEAGKETEISVTITIRK